MDRRFFWTVLVAFAFALCAPTVGAQPVGGDTLTTGDLQIIEDPIQVWVALATDQNPVPDTFYVHQAADGQYWRSKIDGGEGGYFWRCPTPERLFSLSASQSAFSMFSDRMEQVVRFGATGGLPDVTTRAECVNRFSTTLDSLLSILDGQPKTTKYATECGSNVNNATVHVPASAEWSGVEAPAVGDTLAVREPGGDCVGWGVWTEQGATMAAAMSDNVIEEYWPEWDFLRPGEAMAFEVYKADRNRVFPADPSFASCDVVGVPICRDQNGAEDGVLFQVASLSFDPL